MATKKNSHSSKAKPNGKHLQSTTTAISKRQTLSGVHKKTNASLSSGSRKAVNSKLTETIDASLDDLRVVYNSTIQKQTKLAERMERMDEKRRVEERKQVEKEKSMQTDVDLNAALDMLSGFWMLCLVQSIQSRYKAIYGHSVMSKRTASKKCLPRQSNVLVKPSSNPDSPLWISKFADGSIRLNTLVKPGTKVSQVIDIQGDAVGIQIAAVAREGEANAELIQTVADVLKLRKYQVAIVAGHKSRTKVLKIDTLLSIEQIQEMILSSMPQ